MPRRRKRQKRRRQDYGPEHVKALRHGFDFFNVFRDEDDMREAWNTFGKEIMDEWVKRFPGTRHMLWWQFDAPEPRRCVNGVHPFDDPQRERLVAEWRAQYPAIADAKAYKLHRGKPRCLIPGAGDFDKVYETQPKYLRRLNLLRPGEVPDPRAEEDSEWDPEQDFRDRNDQGHWWGDEDEPF